MSKLKPAISTKDHQFGNNGASITLVEYGDFECPHCGLAHQLIKRLVREMGDAFLFAFRNFPLREIHPHAYIAAIAAEASGKQDKFWEMHDIIFENQTNLSSAFLIASAKQIGLDLEQFTDDMKSQGIRNKIESDFESGIRSGVNGTPTFFINGSRVSTYDESYESLVDAVQRESKLNTL